MAERQRREGSTALVERANVGRSDCSGELNEQQLNGVDWPRSSQSGLIRFSPLHINSQNGN